MENAIVFWKKKKKNHGCLTPLPPLDKMAGIFADDNFECIFLNMLNEMIPTRISIKDELRVE